MLRKRKFSALEAVLGYRFKDQGLLERALTHSSAGVISRDVSDNERLEFLGDRVLGLVIAEYLFNAFPDATEGEMARRFNRLVRKEACARVGESIKLGEFLILSEAEDSSGGRNKATIVADAVEALLAAIFLDGGFEKVRRVARLLWADLKVDDVDGVVTDAKSALQEWAQGRGVDLPVYKVISRDGPDHAPRFTIEVRLRGVDASVGKGRSKREAEQAAAGAVLVREGVWTNLD